jgi:hypothetical protein
MISRFDKGVKSVLQSTGNPKTGQNTGRTQFSSPRSAADVIPIHCLVPVIPRVSFPFTLVNSKSIFELADYSQAG